MYPQPRTEPGIWFHDLPPVATIWGAIVAADAGSTAAGMAMVMVYGREPGEYATETTSGIGKSEEGEALTPLLCARRLPVHTYWVVPDSESAVGALRTY